VLNSVSSGEETEKSLVLSMALFLSHPQIMSDPKI
jgi:hypothetical protein